MLQRRLHIVIQLITVTMVMIVIPTTTTTAYVVKIGFEGRGSSSYAVDPNIDALLSANQPNPVNGARDQINAAATLWNNASRFTLLSTNWPNPNNEYVTAANFTTSDPCGYTGIAAAVMFSCGTARRIYLNSSGTYVWNTTNNLSGNNRDVQATVLQEFGHWLGMDHPPDDSRRAVMSVLRRPLAEDDKQGNVQLYGPRTGFQPERPQGIVNEAALRLNVGPYNNSIGGPELGVRTAELGVPVWESTHYLMLAGTAQASYSYAYMRLFSAEQGSVLYDQTNPIVGQYLRIANGMELRWRQYNFQRSTMSLDILFTDGTTMRNTADAKDQNGVRVHPALRGGYGLNTWHYFNVNLSAMQGRRIKTIYVAYDNGNNGQTGQYRAYFDDVHIVYPSSFP